MLKKIVMSVIVVILIVVLSQLASQFYTLNTIKTGLTQKDASLLLPLIDFEAVKASVKSQLEANLKKKYPLPANSQIDKDIQAVAITMQNTVIDKTITPEMLTKLMEFQAKDKNSTPWSLKASYKFIDVSQFSVGLTVEGKSEITVVFAREGLFGWKIRELILPSA